MWRRMEDALVLSSFSFKVYCALFSITILERSVAGMLTLSPMMVVPVCDVGGPLQITCTARVEFQRWSILRFNEQGILEKITNDVTINSRDPYNQMTPAVVNSATFTFIRSSAQEDSPLISTLSIDSVNIGLNGTIVQCMDVANPMTLASTTIQIVDVSQNVEYSPTLRIIEKYYEADNITVTLEWSQHESVTYSHKIVPLPVAPLMSTESGSYQLTLLYDTKYNVSVVATTPCRPNATDFIILHYAYCGHPKLFTVSNDSLPIVEGYDDIVPAEGTTVMFSCPLGLVLSGPDSSTCEENGDWEPDPNGLICNVSSSEEIIKLENHTTSQMLSIIGIVAAVIFIILCIVVTIVIIAAVMLHRKGFRNKKTVIKSVQGGQVTTTRHLDHDQEQHQPEPEALIYADVNVASKHKKKRKPQPLPSVHDQTNDFDVQYSAINHDLIVRDRKHRVHMTKENTSCNDDILDVSLDNLLSLLRDKVGPKWHEFGEALGIDEVVLDSIAKSTFTENCIVEVLDYWLEYYDGKPTWSDVVEALYDINLEKLALDIEQVYKAGEFPSEADTYVNVTNTLPAAKTFQPPAVSFNESNCCKHHKSPNFPPPIATKPKPGIQKAPMQKFM